MKKRKYAALVSIIMAFAAFIFFERPLTIEKEGLYYVKRVIDGDTIVLANGEHVRYIGINAPETKHSYKPAERFGKEAYLYNKELVDKKQVRLEFDIERRDRYNRLLAYVYVGNTFVNAELVEKGFAQIYTFPPNIKYQELFLRLQREARDSRRGLWRKGMGNL